MSNNNRYGMSQTSKEALLAMNHFFCYVPYYIRPLKVKFKIDKATIGAVSVRKTRSPIHQF